VQSRGHDHPGKESLSSRNQKRSGPLNLVGTATTIEGGVNALLHRSHEAKQRGWDPKRSLNRGVGCIIYHERKKIFSKIGCLSRTPWGIWAFKRSERRQKIAVARDPRKGESFTRGRVGATRAEGRKAPGRKFEAPREKTAR